MEIEISKERFHNTARPRVVLVNTRNVYTIINTRQFVEIRRAEKRKIKLFDRDKSWRGRQQRSFDSLGATIRKIPSNLYSPSEYSVSTRVCRTLSSLRRRRRETDQHPRVSNRDLVNQRASEVSFCHDRSVISLRR